MRGGKGVSGEGVRAHECFDRGEIEDGALSGENDSCSKTLTREWMESPSDGSSLTTASDRPKLDLNIPRNIFLGS